MTDKEVVQEIIDEMGRTAERWGFPKVFGEAWGMLYFEGDMTQDELRDKLKCSLSVISQSLNIMVNFGVVEVSGKKGRKNIYSAQRGLKQYKRKMLESALLLEVNPMLAMLSTRQNDIKDKALKEKVQELHSKYSRAESFIKLILKLPFGKG